MMGKGRGNGEKRSEMCGKKGVFFGEEKVPVQQYCRCTVALASAKQNQTQHKGITMNL